ncbi:MAG: type II secretion system F family protein [Acetatifactor sp.]
MIDPLERKKYLFKDFYGVGFQLLEILNYSYDSPLDRKRKAQAQIVYGEQYAEYYYRVNMAEKVTYASFCIVIAPLLGPLFKTPVMMVFGLIAAVVLWAYSDSKITDIIKEREEIITKDFCNVVSKMALLFNAGMITREAWQTIAATGQGTLYDEMRNAVDEMENGTSEVDAYINFGNRCGVPFVKKFISMLIQNIIKGPKDVADFLKKESAVCWEEKKHIVRRQGEAAANKLMIPLGMILIGIFIMILVPVLSKIGM